MDMSLRDHFAFILGGFFHKHVHNHGEWWCSMYVQKMHTHKWCQSWGLHVCTIKINCLEIRKRTFGFINNCENHP